MMTRCPILAHRVGDEPIYRCPTSMTAFHYHGYDPSQPYRPLVGGYICSHRHKTMESANRCAVGNMPKSA